VGSAVNINPITREALEACDFERTSSSRISGAAARDGIESGIAQAENRVADAEAAVLGDGDDLGRGVTNEDEFSESAL